MKRILLVITLIITLTLGVSCASGSVKGVESSISETGDIKKVKVTANQANIRTGCSNDAPVKQTTNKNNKLDVVNKVADWYAVKLPDNSIGFVPQNQCTPIVADSAQGKGAPNTGAKPPTTTPGTTDTGKTTPQGTPYATNEPNTNDTAKTENAANTNGGSLSSEEQEMLRLVNEARAQKNLPALKAELNVANVARIKSQDMIDNNYFSHNSPKYGSPFDMLKSFGVSYVKAGENIAGNNSVQKAHEGLMNSPGHRANILSPDYTHIGIGIKNGGQYGKMFTQMFLSRPQ